MSLFVGMHITISETARNVFPAVNYLIFYVTFSCCDLGKVVSCFLIVNSAVNPLVILEVGNKQEYWLES